jgi:hypothetical protein
VVELLAPAVPFERAYPEAPYLRGLAFLRLQKGADPDIPILNKAKAEYAKLAGSNVCQTRLHSSAA